MLEFAEGNGFAFGDTKNPAQWDGVQQHKFQSGQPKKGRRHHKAPKYREVPDIIRRTRTHEDRSVGAVAFRFAMYTGKRTSEVLKAEWPEFNDDYTVWTIPRERMKKNDEEEDHVVPVPSQAKEILLLRKSQSRGSRYVFPSYDTRKPLGKHGMSGLFKRMGIPFTVHGTVRATFKQWAREQTNYPNELSEISLAHKVGNNVEESYARNAQALERRRPLMQDWANFCDSGADWGFLAAP